MSPKQCFNYDSGEYEWIDEDGYSWDQNEYVNNWDDSEYEEERRRREEEEKEEEEERRRLEEEEEEERSRREEEEESYRWSDEDDW